MLHGGDIVNHAAAGGDHLLFPRHRQHRLPLPQPEGIQPLPVDDVLQGAAVLLLDHLVGIQKGIAQPPRQPPS